VDDAARAIVIDFRFLSGRICCLIVKLDSVLRIRLMQMLSWWKKNSSKEIVRETIIYFLASSTCRLLRKLKQPTYDVPKIAWS
jgi:hypothetical protein